MIPTGNDVRLKDTAGQKRTSSGSSRGRHFGDSRLAWPPPGKSSSPGFRVSSPSNGGCAACERFLESSSTPRTHNFRCPARPRRSTRVGYDDELME